MKKLLINLRSIKYFLYTFEFPQLCGYLIKFVFDLIITLSVASLFMRLCIILGCSQAASLAVGILIAVSSNFYIKFRNRF